MDIVSYRIHTIVPSATRCGFNSACDACSKQSWSGPWGVIILCKLPPPGANPSSCKVRGNQQSDQMDCFGNDRVRVPREGLWDCLVGFLGKGKRRKIFPVVFQWFLQRQVWIQRCLPRSLNPKLRTALYLRYLGFVFSMNQPHELTHTVP